MVAFGVHHDLPRTQSVCRPDYEYFMDFPQHGVEAVAVVETVAVVEAGRCSCNYCSLPEAAFVGGSSQGIVAVYAAEAYEERHY